MSNGMSQIIGLKENGLPQVTRLLQSGNSDVVKTGAALLSNMSRHPSLHRTMGKRHIATVCVPHPSTTILFSAYLF